MTEHTEQHDGFSALEKLLHILNSDGENTSLSSSSELLSKDASRRLSKEEFVYLGYWENSKNPTLLALKNAFQDVRTRQYVQYQCRQQLPMALFKNLYAHVFVPTVNSYGKDSDGVPIHSYLRDLKRNMYRALLQSHGSDDPRVRYIQEHGLRGLQEEAFFELEMDPKKTVGFSYKHLRHYDPGRHHATPLQHLGFPSSWAERCAFLFADGIPSLLDAMFYRKSDMFDPERNWYAVGVSALQKKFGYAVRQDDRSQWTFSDLDNVVRTLIPKINSKAAVHLEDLLAARVIGGELRAYTKHVHAGVHWAIQSGIDCEIVAHALVNHVLLGKQSQLHLWKYLVSTLPSPVGQKMIDYAYLFGSDDVSNYFSIDTVGLEKYASSTAKVLRTFIPLEFTNNDSMRGWGIETESGRSWWNAMYINALRPTLEALDAPLHDEESGLQP